MFALVYTIPSLAFFQLMVPFTGLTRLSAEIALVSYTLLILFRNILTGLREVPADALEAAQAMGLTRRQTLWRVELPLAMPAIMAGIRIATVTIISLATVAAFIGVGGLGEPIFNAIQTGFKTQFIAAGVLAVLLALVTDAILVVVQRAAHAVGAGEGGLSMHSIIDAFQFIGDNLHFMLTKTLEHVALAGAAIAVSLVIAIPLGVTLGHLHKGSFLAINASNIGRALPSLAIISIGIGILGIGFINVMVAMVVLAVPPMLTNAYVAVDGVDPDAVEAARAVGMSPRQVLWKVEIPLAIPLMFAGIRTGAVYVVATATLAAIAGGGGLGDVIVNQASYGTQGVIAGALMVTALAFLVEGILAVVQRMLTPRALRRGGAGRPARAGRRRYVSNEEEEQAMRGTMRRLIAWSLLAAAMAFAVAACGSSNSSSTSSSSSSSAGASAAAAAQPGKGKPAVTIGTKDFTEEFILGELYKQALQARGYTVNLKKNIGATEIIDTALTSHKIDGYPEYTGESVATVAKRNEPAKTAAEEYQLAKQFYETRGQTVSNPTPFQDVDAIATTKAFAAKNKLATMEDLKKIGSFSLGARPEFKNRQQGLAGMKKVYGIDNAKFRQLALGVQYQAMDTGKVDTANIFTTDAQLASGKYAVLTDPKGVFGFQNVAFVIDKNKLAQLGGDQFMNVINGVNKLLTTPAITAMNKAVAIDKQDEATVAKQFLTANHLT